MVNCGIASNSGGVATLKRSEYINYLFENNAELECVKIEGDYAVLFIFKKYACLTDYNNTDALGNVIKGDDYIDKAFAEFFDLENFLDEALYKEESGEDYAVDFD